MGTRDGVASLRILAPAVMLAAIPRLAFAQGATGAGSAIGPLGWLFLFFALAGGAVGFILLRRLQQARLALAQAETERDLLRSREAALSMARIRWRSGGGFEAEDN